ncbi:Beta-phosphoglucomutase [Sandaracinus amylolyticus]|uniref:Beta-phosphoglucomutase n=1 Tax=Sandaracinus amylolyticus TaxID=927083 RepID=A0A0F6SI29_9BACT|nr:Beta-phosphoglucomutase [Sandaracinus amylolyticus]
MVFDLDGVLTRTARLHAAAWKSLFDGFLRAREGVGFQPFDIQRDYLAYVDGRARRDGVRTFLASRGITLPEGDASDPEGAPTVEGLAAQKDHWFRDAIARDGVEVDEHAVHLVRALRDRGITRGVASSSRNCIPVLERAGILELFDAIVDGNELERMRLASKPAPDMFLECLRRLGAFAPADAVVVEDATAGVAAGRAGGFGLVVGVDRGGNRDALRDHGAHWVVSSMAELTVARLEAQLAR